MRVRHDLIPEALAPRLGRFWDASAPKILSIERAFPADSPVSPVFTIDGRYGGQEWTDWTRGFQIGAALLQFDATGDPAFLEMGRRATAVAIPEHITATGVHDHGFNEVSTHGNLWRLAGEGRFEATDHEIALHELALRCSGATQAGRWTQAEAGGFIYSFNGPHSLFVDTIRSLRSLALAHRLGHVLRAEGGRPVSLLGRCLEHAGMTAEYNVYYGAGRDVYDVRGRVAHESIFNTIDGSYRCPSTQQGYSPFSTWTRGLAWAMLGFAELLEFLEGADDGEPADAAGIAPLLLEAARATCDYYIEATPIDGIPYWDTAAPGLVELGDYLERPADPFNGIEPVDSSAAAIAAQALLRLGHHLGSLGGQDADTYTRAGLTILDALFDAPYLDEDPTRHGLILHSLYHRPRGWDHLPAAATAPHGEATMWGDYHAREVAVYLQRLIDGGPYHAFFGS
jgi:hypothetical protein